QVSELVTRPRADVTSTFTREGVEEISRRNDEPGWLRERRLVSFAEFLRRPTPLRTDDEDYRRTDLRRLDLNAFSPTVDGSRPSASRTLPTSIRGVLGDAGKDGGAIVLENGAVARTSLSDELKAKGVILCSLAEAVREHADLVRPYFEHDRVGADEDKWTAMNA